MLVGIQVGDAPGVAPLPGLRYCEGVRDGLLLVYSPDSIGTLKVPTSVVCLTRDLEWSFQFTIRGTSAANAP